MPNRLASETSPYLLQHRDNPVDWYPWGPDALDRARAEDLPILLSVGYSACHWCHVMERESFEDKGTARLMNERFVNIKVDREERPDIDSLYMSAVQQMTGHGGWPMTVFLTPDGSPFYGGTYFPPEPRGGMPSFRQVLTGVSDAYHQRRDQVDRSAAELTQSLRQSAQLQAPQRPLEPAALDSAARAITRNFEPRYGGFGRAPKFPQPMTLEFLLRQWKRTGDAELLGMVERTLEMMWRGGMYDHVGGGFHRYSVDDRWLVPHFEKMLYDNALLARVYLNAHLATGKPLYEIVAREVLDYVLREMQAPHGGFHSALDADSEGEEGRFYVWTSDEIDNLLGAEDGPAFRAYLGVEPGGNFEGKSIPNPARDMKDVASELGIEPERLAAAVSRGRDVLYDARAQRVWPGLDDKVITGWNAMMLRSFAEAGAAFDEPRYVEAAKRCAEFLLGDLTRDGRLLRTYRDEVAKIGAFLEDHALLADSLISLYQTTFDTLWVREARRLADAMLDLFWDDDAGLFYDTARDADELVIRPRDYHDNATPSGNSTAVTMLLRLTALTGEPGYERVATRVLESFAPLLDRAPQAFGEMLCAAAFQLAPPREIAIVGDPVGADTAELLRVLRSRYLPDAVIALRDPAASESETAADVPLLAERGLVDGRAAAYVCRRFTCQRPVTSAGELEAVLADSPGPP
jgi:uncharacterized protein YyaL (SSP411 family)